MRNGDAHAWAEVQFPGYGWAPLDTAPRPDLPAYTSGGALKGLMYNLSQWRMGNAVRSNITEGVVRLQNIVTNRAMMLSILVNAALFVTFQVLLRVRRRTQAPAARWRYSFPSSPSRKAALRSYRKLESSLRRRAIQPRGPSETLGGYFARVGHQLPHLKEDRDGLYRALSQVLYAPQDLFSDRASRVKHHLGLLRHRLSTTTSP